MPAGRPSTPDKVLKIHGSYREDRHANRGPKLGGQPLRKPEDLGEHGEWLWDRVTQTRAAWLAVSDEESLRSLCDLWELRMAVLPLVREHPADKDLRCSFNAYHSEWCKLASRFGLTPSDRARLGEDVEDKRANQDVEEMLG